MSESEASKLIDKFFDGKATAEEEVRLRQYFASGNATDSLKRFAAYFSYVARQRKITLPDRNFDERVTKIIEQGTTAAANRKRNTILFSMVTLAAAAVIVIVFSISMNNNKTATTNPAAASSQVIVEASAAAAKDPELAYWQTKSAMLYTSAIINRSLKKIDKLAYLEKGIAELKKLSKIEESFNKVFNPKKQGEKL